MPTLQQLLKMLSNVTAKWYILGVHLHIEAGILDTIKEDHQTTEECMAAMLEKWRQKFPYGDWSGIINALQEMGRNDIAMEVANKYGCSTELSLTISPSSTQPSTISESPLSLSISPSPTLPKLPLPTSSATLSTPRQAPCNEVTIKVPKNVAEKLEKIEDEFYKLVSKMKEALRERLDQKDIARLGSFCSIILPQMKHFHCTNVDDLFDKLKPHLHFLNCSLLKKIDCNYLSGTSKAEIRKYKSALNKFTKSTTVSQFKSTIEQHHPSPPSHDATTGTIVKLKTKDNWLKCTVYNLDRLIKYLFPGNKGSIKLVSIHHSILTIVYTAPRSAILHLTTLASKRVHTIKAIGIIHIQIGSLLIRVLDIVELMRPEYKALTLEDLAFEVIYKGRGLSIMNLLIYIGVDVESTFTEYRTAGITLLMFAAFIGQENIVELLLQQGASVNRQDKTGNTALMHVCNSNATSCIGPVISLLQHGADPNIQDKEGITALTIASYRGHFQKVKILLSCNADLMDDHPQGASALAAASKGRTNAHTRIVIELLRHGADPNKYGYGNNRSPMGPVYVAIIADCFANAKVLLESGANANLQDKKNGWTPLILAVTFGRLELVKLLLENGADATIADKNGETALTYAVRAQDQLHFIRLPPEVSYHAPYGGRDEYTEIARILIPPTLRELASKETASHTKTTPPQAHKYRPEQDALNFAAQYAHFPTLSFHGYQL